MCVCVCVVCVCVCVCVCVHVCICACVQLIIDLVSHYVLINVFNNYYDLDYDKCVARSGVEVARSGS